MLQRQAYDGFIKESLLSLHSLSIYRNLLNDRIILDMTRLIKSMDFETHGLLDFISCYNNFFYTFISQSKCSLKEYIVDFILSDENPFSRGSEKNPGVNFEIMKKAAAMDLDRLMQISEITSEKIKKTASRLFYHVEGIETILEGLPSWDMESGCETGIGKKPASYAADKDDMEKGARPSFHIKNTFLSGDKWSEAINALEDFHKTFGTGDFYKYRAFIWEGEGDKGFFHGVSSPDPIRFSNLVGYKEERSMVIDNTLQFLKGYRANNMLLYGDRGTGKSSTVKALLNEYWHQGLRIIEVPKSRLVDFRRISNLVKDRTHKFIIFVDDLAFEDNEENYTALKAVLEGSTESKPDNVLIYATSNRRHLIKEKFSDRAGLHYGSSDDEVRAMDTMQEKLSLADRFGITVVFSSPDKKRYLEIVEGLAAQKGISIDKEILHKEALKWELWYNGRSPRTARQFIDWLEGELEDLGRA